MLVEEASVLNNTINTAAYLDDVTAADEIIQLGSWWNILYKLGPKFGYFPEVPTFWLILNSNVIHYSTKK